MRPSESLTSFKTAFNLSSNSPLYFAPATNADKSNSKIVLSNSEPGVGKTAIVEGLAQRIVKRDVPESLLDKTIF
ncbi:hypothetical protein PSY27_23690, partial [Shigella flexneri]|nr:hypothetical protein [Shigella flexneri]